jgi:hypothetical protein
MRDDDSVAGEHEVIESADALFRHLYEVHGVEEAGDLDPDLTPVEPWLRRHADLERAARLRRAHAALDAAVAGSAGDGADGGAGGGRTAGGDGGPRGNADDRERSRAGGTLQFGVRSPEADGGRGRDAGSHGTRTPSGRDRAPSQPGTTGGRSGGDGWRRESRSARSAAARQDRQGRDGAADRGSTRSGDAGRSTARVTRVFDQQRLHSAAGQPRQAPPRQAQQEPPAARSSGTRDSGGTRDSEGLRDGGGTRNSGGLRDPLVRAVAAELVRAGHDERAVRRFILRYVALTPDGGLTGEAGVRASFLEPVLDAIAEQLTAAAAASAAAAQRGTGRPGAAYQPDQQELQDDLMAIANVLQRRRASRYSD